jgi:hypothetical protein
MHIPTTSRIKNKTVNISAAASSADLLGLPLNGFGTLFTKQNKKMTNRIINARRAYNTDGVFNSGKTFVFDDVAGSIIYYIIIIQ